MQRVPVILITGFLGSGKTTLLNWMLEKYPEKRISVILNEFGSVSLESKFVKSHAGETIELANGCMCCVAKSDVPRVIELILDQSPLTEYIVIEASGLSDPDPIKESLAGERLRSTVSLYRTICVIDGENFLTTYREHPLILSQAGDADCIVLSKVENMPENLMQTKRIIENNLTQTPLTLWTPEMTLEELMRGGSISLDSGDPHHTHEAMQGLVYHVERGMSREELIQTFAHLPPTIYRAKGYSVLGESRILIQYVAGKLVLQEEESQNPEEFSTHILFLSTRETDKDIFSRV